jgi:hypothetical protein
MGNSFSFSSTKTQPENTHTPSEIIDYIASNYILSMDFINLRKLMHKKYCDKLVVLTSDIMDKYLTELDVDYLDTKLNVNHERVNFLKKQDGSKLDIKDNDKKRRVCLGIAKFYIKIAHVFASIITTINPVYSYKDINQNIIKVPFYKKNEIPLESLPTAKLEHEGLCQNRINSLQSSSKTQEERLLFPEDKEKDEINVSPKMCSINSKMDGTIKSMVDEPGIPELMQLYYDDLFDYTTGKFNGMSDETKTEYLEDLAHFYVFFTGNEEVPPNITKFSDIKLKDYNKQFYCESSNANKSYKSDKNDVPARRELFEKYAENLKLMIQNANMIQTELLKIIDQMFLYEMPDTTQNVHAAHNTHNTHNAIRIHPKLTDKLLQELSISARELIIKLYLTCEMNYANGLKIYEAIVESSIVSTGQKRIDNLEKTAKKIYVPSELPK